LSPDKNCYLPSFHSINQYVKADAHYLLM